MGACFASPGVYLARSILVRTPSLPRAQPPRVRATPQGGPPGSSPALGDSQPTPHSEEYSSMADDTTNPGETESTLNDEGAKYVGPPIRVRATEGDTVREYTTTYIAGDEDVDLLPDVSAITEGGEFIEEVTYDADDLAADNRSWSEIPQPRLAEGSAGGQAGPGLQPSEVEEQRRLAEEQNNPENVNLGAGVPQKASEQKAQPQPAKRAQSEGEKGKSE